MFMSLGQHSQGDQGWLPTSQPVSCIFTQKKIYSTIKKERFCPAPPTQGDQADKKSSFSIQALEKCLEAIIWFGKVNIQSLT